MALTKISASVIAANAIVAAGVAENSISTSEIATDGVGTLQISDGAVTSGKLETNVDIAGTLDVTGVLTADSNVVIAGNLTVNGATVTNSSTNTTIADALIELGTGTTGSPANDAGIVIERGDSDNAFIGWDESADTFILGTGSFTGASTGNLTISTAPLSVGTLTASGITYPTSDGSSGQVLKTDGSGNLTFDAQTAVVDNFTATGDGSTTDFDTGINPGDEVNTWVFIDGVYQQKGEYSYSGSTISFSTAPDSGATIDVTTGTVGGFASADSVLGVYETTTTNTDTYTTGISASNENNTWVFVGGVYQPKDSYTFSSGTLTFDANTPTGQKLSVTATKSLSAGSVETNSITANAVTSAKIASNSILSRHIANNSIVGADISATTQITASTFTGALTGDVTGNVVGNLTGTIQTAAQTNITSVGTLSALTVSGQLTAGGLSYPTSDGTNEQVLRTDGSGNLSFGTISGTTLNNNTNNYVMTGTGTANTLNGESGLIFDGTNLLVGTTDAGYPDFGDNLTIADTGHSGMTIRSGTSSNGTLYFSDATGTGSGTFAGKIAYEHSNNKMLFSTNSLNRLAIDSSGNVGIGMTAPTAVGNYKVLQLQGNSTTNGGMIRIETSDGTSGVARFYAGSGSTVLESNSNTPLAFGTNATTRMTIDTSGNVGIGTSSPSDYYANKFVVSAGYADGITIAASATTYLNYLMFADTTTSAGQGWIGYYHNGDALTFASNSAERMRIDSSGNVGIGKTPNRSRKLEVAGTMNLDDGSEYEWGDGSISIGGNSSTDIMTFATAGTESMRITSTGKVGIGTTNPSDNHLSISFEDSTTYSGTTAQTGNGIFVNNRHYTTTEGFSQIRLGVSGDSGSSYARLVAIEPGQAQSDFAICLRNGSTYFERFRLQGSSGNLVIGGSAGDASRSIIVDPVNNSGEYKGFRFRTGTNNGQPHVGSFWEVHDTTNPELGMKLGSNLYFYMATNGVMSGDFNDTSDRNLKENIVNLEGGLSVINQLQPRTFDWKDQSKGDGHAGFIAQEVEEILPNDVSGTDWYEGLYDTDKPAKAINATAILAHAVKAIQEQQTLIEAQATTITDLTNRIETLEG